MTGLLVSVRNADEAAQAVRGGADVIDVKEPRRGALGAADPEVWHEVRRVLPRGFPLSVALGELVEDEAAERAALATDVQFAKVGLAGCLELTDWMARWERVLGLLPPGTVRVAVAYADHVAARAPAPLDVVRAVSAAGCRTLLLDTVTKARGNLFDHLNDAQLSELAGACHDADIGLVLAGSLRLESIKHAVSFAPKLIAVRGAACIGDRNGTVCSMLVKRLKEQIAANFEGDLISR